MVKIALNAWALDPQTSLETTLEILQAIGYKGVELNLDDTWSVGPGSLTWDMSDEDVLVIGDLCAKHGLEVFSISCSMYDGHLGSHDSEKREHGKNILRRQLHLAQLLKADRILVVPSGDQSHSISQPLKRSLETMQELIPEIEATDLLVGIEQVWDSFFMSPFDVKHYLETLNHPQVGVYFDVGNMLEWQSCESWLEVLKDDIVGLHIKDYQSNVPFSRFNGGEEVRIGHGMCNWEAVIPLLLTTSRDIPWVIESFKFDDAVDYRSFYEYSYQDIDTLIRNEGRSEQ